MLEINILASPTFKHKRMAKIVLIFIFVKLLVFFNPVYLDTILPFLVSTTYFLSSFLIWIVKMARAIPSSSIEQHNNFNTNRTIILLPLRIRSSEDHGHCTSFEIKEVRPTLGFRRYENLLLIFMIVWPSRENAY